MQSWIVVGIPRLARDTGSIPYTGSGWVMGRERRVRGEFKVNSRFLQFASPSWRISGIATTTTATNRMAFPCLRKQVQATPIRAFA